MPNNLPVSRARAPLANAARARQGVPDSLPVHSTPVTGQAELPDLLLMLRSGQISPEVLIQLLSALGGLGTQLPAGPGAPGGEIAEAFYGGEAAGA